MVIIAILLDIVAAAAYVVQAQSMTAAFFTLGVVLQIVISLILLIMMVRYQGRRRARYWTGTYHPFTFGFGIITLSFVVNALMAVLYVFNLLNINNIVFSH
ncbi:hypothetical protein [Lacticaseibacillus songhuajiangensis]|jgi:hypothetical protein|uniref:hypothetical protein n=1 Tax=Lacticaseibacillus songhuajiangensis TaxID=1296539 RepID=UPI000F7743D2|nr:hypothetical protein [Lacticaseibacillus songhuajiangensis]MCI1284266.1 hypothetical protein [Lacticaseibacillus songhuajiangensis]